MELKSNTYASISDNFVSPPQTAIMCARETIEEAVRLSERIGMLTDRILGPQPIPQAVNVASEKREMPSGVLPDLSDYATRASRAISTAHDALSRLDNAI